METMLVLSRKAKERILIGKDIVVIVNRIRGSVVSVGIEAPKGTRVLRGELLDRDKRDAA
jgi:carbon storage regulator